MPACGATIASTRPRGKSGSAWLAAGRLDAYYERGVKHWDVAAGLLLCERAGLGVRRLAAADGAPAGVLVAPPPLLEPLTELVG